MTDPRSFGAWLTRERERRAITLRAIADRTKIGVGLLAALERGDVSRWPGGIYRRSFVRGYADVVGLDADLVIANFERVFPDPEAPRAPEAVTAPPAPRPAADEGEMRLLLAGPPKRVAAWKTAAYDVGFPIAFGLLGFVAAGAIGFWCATAVAALVYRLSIVFGVLSARSSAPASAPATTAPQRIAAVIHFRNRTSRRVGALSERAASVGRQDLVKQA